MKRSLRFFLALMTLLTIMGLSQAAMTGGCSGPMGAGDIPCDK